jgi:sec-independent protein translocase protein TatB
MFPDLSWSHMLLVLVVALVVVGPKDLPKLMRTMGRWAGKARSMADQFRKSFDEMARQSELDELRQELEELRHARPLAETEQALMKPLVETEQTRTAPLPPASVTIEEPKSVEPSEPIAEGQPSAPASNTAP